MAEDLWMVRGGASGGGPGRLRRWPGRRRGRCGVVCIVQSRRCGGRPGDRSLAEVRGVERGRGAANGRGCRRRWQPGDEHRRQGGDAGERVPLLQPQQRCPLLHGQCHRAGPGDRHRARAGLRRPGLSGQRHLRRRPEPGVPVLQWPDRCALLHHQPVGARPHHRHPAPVHLRGRGLPRPHGGGHRLPAALPLLRCQSRFPLLHDQLGRGRTGDRHPAAIPVRRRCLLRAGGGRSPAPCGRGLPRQPGARAPGRRGGGHQPARSVDRQWHPRQLHRAGGGGCGGPGRQDPVQLRAEPGHHHPAEHGQGLQQPARRHARRRRSGDAQRR